MYTYPISVHSGSKSVKISPLFGTAEEKCIFLRNSDINELKLALLPEPVQTKYGETKKIDGSISVRIPDSEGFESHFIKIETVYVLPDYLEKPGLKSFGNNGEEGILGVSAILGSGIIYFKPGGTVVWENTEHSWDLENAETNQTSPGF
jgi:hypothetical protein